MIINIILEYVTFLKQMKKFWDNLEDTNIFSDSFYSVNYVNAFCSESFTLLILEKK